MIVINTQEELEALIDNNNNIIINDDLMLICNIEINANIKAENINAMDIEARDIIAEDINAVNIKAWDIEAENINAEDIEAWNIEAVDINALNISYYAVCFAYTSINCKSIKGSHDNSKHFALDGEITIINNNK